MVDDPKYFFTPTSYGAKPQVKRTVLEWIKDLRGDPKCDLFAKSMLDLIENHMLVVDKKDRFRADRVCSEILSIVTRLSTSPPAIRIYHEHSGSRRCNESYEARAKGSGNSRHFREQKESETKTSMLSEEKLVPHIEGCWDSRSSNYGMEPKMGNSSNDGSADEGVDSPMTPDSISLDDNPALKRETEIEIEEWRLNAM